MGKCRKKMDLFSQRGPTFIEPPTFIEVYGIPRGIPAAFDSEHDENTWKFDFDFGHGEKIKNHKLSEICNY